jgi:transposase
MCQAGDAESPEKERASMNEVGIIGIDMAKGVFQLHGAAADGSVVFRKKLTRAQLLPFLARQPASVVAMEACGTAHHWGREAAKLGHEVRLIGPTRKPSPRRPRGRRCASWR